VTAKGEETMRVVISFFALIAMLLYALSGQANGHTASCRVADYRGGGSHPTEARVKMLAALSDVCYRELRPSVDAVFDRNDAVATKVFDIETAQHWLDGSSLLHAKVFEVMEAHKELAALYVDPDYRDACLSNDLTERGLASPCPYAILWGAKAWMPFVAFPAFHDQGWPDIVGYHDDSSEQYQVVIASSPRKKGWIAMINFLDQHRGKERAWSFCYWSGSFKNLDEVQNIYGACPLLACFERKPGHFVLKKWAGASK
jgi:hypothetical protein